MTMEKANNLIAKKLKKKPCLASECETAILENIDKDGLFYFNDLMEESSLLSCLNILDKDYEDAICNQGELDERLFINEEDNLFALGSLSGGSMSARGVKRKFDQMASPEKTIRGPLFPQSSPASYHANGVPISTNSKMAASLVTTAMTTTKWFHTVICPLPLKPLIELEKFPASCDRDITSDVLRRAILYYSLYFLIVI